MKTIFPTVIVLICSLAGYAQKSLDESQFMIDSAINITYSNYKEATKNQNINYFENLYLINEQDQPLNYLPSSNKFKSISIYDHRNRKFLRKRIHAWKVFTAINANRFIVTIVDFYITYKNHNYNFGNGGGSQTVFKYDCQKGSWQLVSSQIQGN